MLVMPEIRFRMKNMLLILENIGKFLIVITVLNWLRREKSSETLKLQKDRYYKSVKPKKGLILKNMRNFHKTKLVSYCYRLEKFKTIFKFLEFNNLSQLCQRKGKQMYFFFKY